MNINTTSSIKQVRTTNLQHPLGDFQQGSPAITQTFNRSFAHLFAVLHHINCCQFYAINYGRNPSMEVERERELFKVLLFCLYISLTYFVFLLHSWFGHWVYQVKNGGCSTTPLQSLQAQSCTVCSSGVGAGCAGPKTNCYKKFHVVLFAGSFEHMIS